ncbi:hypothetical protein BC826DRAFT_1071843 [Russula brevipes]|nr:hypothetical protein BC826DRAFT_1071843 [Russula brevipes]
MSIGIRYTEMTARELVYRLWVSDYTFHKLTGTATVQRKVIQRTKYAAMKIDISASKYSLCPTGVAAI